ncbi:ABC transporter ATP-binding protein [Neisseria weaveri]|uniref:ABC transporter ATP-binding protein n=1 Tax=Neisseria weaveri TaxID=28091 RepID=UPI000D30FB09|nr:ABC transporter ATP-binding protein [Neisseria weaveri]
MLTVTDLNLSYPPKTVLNRFSLHVEADEIICLLGQSGCGKTTALRTIAGFEQPENGSIAFNGQTLFDSHTYIPAHKREIGMVFQDYALFPHLSTAENIAFGLQKSGKEAKQKRIKEMLALIDMTDYADRYPHQLSGGQQQRIALARALAPSPKLILLDEPFSNLDADLRTRLSKDIRHMLKQTHTAAILVTHDRQEAFTMADKVGMMVEGRLKQFDTPRQIYHAPADEYIASFCDAGSIISGRIVSPMQIGTALGIIDLTAPCSYPAGQSIKILLRNNNIVHNPQAAVQATVAEQNFRGCHTVYTLQLDNGETVALETDSFQNFPIGTRLPVQVRPENLVLFPA